MRKYLLVFIALLFTAAVVAATMRNHQKKSSGKINKERCVKKAQCAKFASVACY